VVCGPVPHLARTDDAGLFHAVLKKA
jgi:hypothetical protein